MSTDSKLFKVFIGSSSEASMIAEQVSKGIDSLCDKYKVPLQSLYWRDKKADIRGGAFNSFLDRFIDNVLEQCDFAIFILTPDDILIKRKEKSLETKMLARDNIWLEAGMFIGKKGKKKIYFFVNGDTKKDMIFPSDIDSSMLGTCVDWDKNIVDLYFNRKSFLEKHPDLQESVKRQFKSKITNDINSYCEKVVFKYIKPQIDKESSVEESKVTTITDIAECFEVGKELVAKAKTRLLTSISFPKSLIANSDYEKQMYKKMHKALRNKIVKKQSKNFEFIRYIKNVKDNTAIQKHFKDFDTLTKKFHIGKVKEIMFDCLEIIVSDNNVSLAFPDYRDFRNKKSPYDRVAFCIQINDNKNFADIISAWLKHHLTPCKNICTDCKKALTCTIDKKCPKCDFYLPCK